MKKTLTVLLALVLVIAMSVAGTMAYLTSTDTVTNSFTVGEVKITLDELDTDEDDNKADNVKVGDTVRDKANAYNLIPGHVYTKDPTVHVDPKSEDSWVFVKVENGIAAYEAAASNTDPKYTPIATQITENGWTALGEAYPGVYYMAYTKNAAGANLVVFENFKISGTANTVAGWNTIAAVTNDIKVTAYAIQKDGFTDPAAAWKELNPAPSTTPNA